MRDWPNLGGHERAGTADMSNDPAINGTVPPQHGVGGSSELALNWAGLEDATRLALLQAACRSETSGHEAWSAADWQTLLNQPGVLAAFVRRAPSRSTKVAAGLGSGKSEDCGFALVRVVLDEAELYAIGVVPSMRRHGIATALLHEISASAALLGARKLFLEVAQSNAPARAFYVKKGFQKIGKRENYYSGLTGAEPALIMSCRLSDGKVAAPGPAM